MQLLIDMPNGLYNAITNDKYGVHKGKLYDIIRNGIQLEKHDEEVIKETVESIWGKPPYTELLDKIKVEIENYDNFIICANGQKGIHIDKALEIIDKYKESEEK